MSDLGNKAIMAQNIQRLMEQAGKSRTQVCDDLGIKYTTFTDWVNAKTYPRIDKIELMANYFGVSKADLVESRGSSMEVERQKKLEDLAVQIREQARLLKATVDSTYNFYDALGSMVGLSKPVPRDIALKPQQSAEIEREIKSLVEKFLATADSEETADFWVRYDKIGREFREKMEHPEEAPYPSLEEMETYSELAEDFLIALGTTCATEAPPNAPEIPSDSKQ